MKMTFRQFMVFVCDLMFCLLLFCLFMQSKPVPQAWGILGFSAFLVMLLIGIYFFVNLMFDAFFE